MTCTCQENLSETEETTEVDHVPDFSVSGFDDEQAAPQTEALTQFEQLQVEALKLSVCVGASYNSSTRKVCFSVPIYGKLCVKLPISIPIPINAKIKVCAQTCGSIIPTGLKVTIYINGKAVLTKVVVGRC